MQRQFNYTFFILTETGNVLYRCYTLNYYRVLDPLYDMYLLHFYESRQTRKVKRTIVAYTYK